MADTHKNFAYSTVATAPSPALSGTSLVVAAGEGALFPTVPFNLTIWEADEAPLNSNAEIVKVTAISTDTLTIVRAQEGTVARTVVVGDQVANTITAKVLTDAETTITKSVSQTAHGFSVGDWLYLDGADYELAQADDPVTTEVVGVVVLVNNANTFSICTGGHVTGLSGLTAGTTYFLSESSAGDITDTEPSGGGEVSKPVLIADSTTSGFFYNMRGFILEDTTEEDNALALFYFLTTR